MPKSSRKATSSKQVRKPYQFGRSIHTPAHERMVDLLREARLKAGLSQEQACELLSVGQSRLSDIERGERRVDVLEFLTLCRTYNTDPAVLLKELAKIL